ncbi:conserved hypothetical protein [Enterobacterales bacterium 8AC]|nr:conserved hypothetical protein [Enterobacterales bacterium 8AC]
MEYIGSRWWRFDFHTHTPASLDYGKDDHSLKNTVTPRSWLMDFINKGIECVAVTDHNTAGWVDLLKVEAESLRKDGHSIYIFPGVKISAHGNIHILGIFDPSTTADDITRLMGAVEFHGTSGDSNAVTEYSPQQVLEKIVRRNGVAIPAHIDLGAGLCKAYSSHTLKQNLEHATAVEVVFRHEQYEETEVKSSPLRSYINLNLGLSEVLSSDAHRPCEVGRGFTWVKMCAPTIEGVRLALLDGDVSIKRSDLYPDDPNIYASNRITGLLVGKTKYCGRGRDFETPFHPWLNCIIGGRGSGKSSILEFLRIGLGRKSEFSEYSFNSEIKNTFDKFAKKPKHRGDDGVLRDDSIIQILYRKDFTEYRLTWEYVNSEIKIEHYEKDTNEWVLEEGNILTRFPARIFSQKQIYDIAKHPNSLLKIIDSTDSVDRFSWESNWNEIRTKFLQARIKYRDLALKIKQKSDIVGQLSDVNRKIILIEKSGHAKILVGYLSAANKKIAIDEFRSGVENKLNELKSFYEEFLFEEVNKDSFAQDNDSDKEFIIEATNLHSKMMARRVEILKLIESGIGDIENYNAWLAASKINDEIKINTAIYEAHVSKLREGGVSNPNEYQLLVNLRKELDVKLKGINNFEFELAKVDKEVKLLYAEMIETRKLLTSRRRNFIEETLKGNKLIHVSIEPFSDEQFLDSGFRKVISREDGVFSNDLFNQDDEKKSGILHKLNEAVLESSDDIDGCIHIINNFKRGLRHKGNANILGYNLSKRFVDFKDSLSPEIYDQILCWFPEDAVRVRYLDGKKMKDISQGSAGQKAATILSFLLSYGEEPLILDQPEDDLDNQLIYDLIVKKIQENKSKRQIIIVTHNPNIVVNGDSELVISLNENKGMSEILCIGGLQDLSVRHAVCNIMEGGRMALQQRYRRIMNS